MRNLTIFVPALNEEAKLEIMINSLLPVARSALEQFEILVVDDGSTDRTGAIADDLAKANPEIRVIHHAQRKGLGPSFYECITKAKFEYLTVDPGDNAYNAESLRQVFEAVGSADLIVTYRANSSHARTFHRVILSAVYSRMMSLLFGLNLKDIHSVVIYPVARTKGLKLELTNYTYQLEVLVKLVRTKPTIAQVPVLLNTDGSSNSRSLSMKTFREILKLMWHLFTYRD